MIMIKFALSNFWKIKGLQRGPGNSATNSWIRVLSVFFMSIFLFIMTRLIEFEIQDLNAGGMPFNNQRQQAQAQRGAQPRVM